MKLTVVQQEGFHRLEWWTRLFIIMFSDVQILLLGMGYGMPLTEAFIITELREPQIPTYLYSAETD